MNTNFHPRASARTRRGFCLCCMTAAGFTVSGVLRFEDHHHYGPSDIRRMADMAAM